MYTRRDGDRPLKTGVAAECPGGRGGRERRRREGRTAATAFSRAIGRGSRGQGRWCSIRCGSVRSVIDDCDVVIDIRCGHTALLPVLYRRAFI